MLYYTSLFFVYIEFFLQRILYSCLCVTRKAFVQTIRSTLQLFFLFFLPTIGKYLGGLMLDRYTDYFRKVFWDSMDNRNSVTKIKRGDLIDSLLNNMNDSKGMLAQAAIFFVAGRETSIATMTCALFELAKQPEMQKRVREETHKTIQDANDVTYEAVHNMKYLHQVINETLLYPPVPIIDRFPLSDYIFPGTKITDKKDIPVYVVLFGI
ncbi:CP6K1 protein, partial [Acromyrmex charruanus]